MKSLPLIVPAGCTLSPDGLADQAGRAARLLPSVANVERSPDVMRVWFGEGVDHSLVDEVVSTEQGCCSFLEIEYHGAGRMLKIGAHDARGREVIGQLTEFFGGQR